jgi:penicillin-binding protein 1A
MTVRSALRSSSNRAAVRTLEDVGVGKAADQAQKMGLGNVPRVPSLALGSGEVTLMAMTSAYAAFADDGRLHTASLIRRVEDAEGHILLETKPSARQVVSPRTAFLMTSMLADVVNYGTAYRVRQEGFTYPAAGKTGTTNDYVDAWFVGFTPKLVTGVWLGFDKRRTIIANGFAGELAVPMWARFMRQATEKDEPAPFKPPKDLTTASVCRLSGRLPGPYCDKVVTEYFARGAAPTEVCDQHFLFTPPAEQVVTTFNRGAGDSLAHMPQNYVMPPAPVAAVSQAPPPSIVMADGPDEQPRKKRGFWGRLFGRRGDDNEKGDSRDDRRDQGDEDRRDRRRR